MCTLMHFRKSITNKLDDKNINVIRIKVFSVHTLYSEYACSFVNVYIILLLQLLIALN